MSANLTVEQAKLQLQVYDLRRESKLRQARQWLFRNYHVKTFDDVMRIAGPGTEGWDNVNMVTSYWEQACGLLNAGLLNDDLFFESSGEFFGVWEFMKGVMPQIRERMANPQYCAQIEKASKRFEAWSEKRAPGHLDVMRGLMKQMPTSERPVAATA